MAAGACCCCSKSRQTPNKKTVCRVCDGRVYRTESRRYHSNDVRALAHRCACVCVQHRTAQPHHNSASETTHFIVRRSLSYVTVTGHTRGAKHKAYGLRATTSHWASRSISFQPMTRLPPIRHEKRQPTHKYFMSWESISSHNNLESSFIFLIWLN